MKAVILLALALFLIAAPEPDAGVISELTHRLVVLDRDDPLQAAETDRELPREARADRSD